MAVGTVNRITLVGPLGNDPVIRRSQLGRKIAHINLVTLCPRTERELEAISFAAHGAGDQKALARLETIKAHAVNRGADMKSLDAAITEAKRRVAEAKADEAAADQRRVAHELRELAKVMRSAAKKCDDGLAMLTEGAKEIRTAIAQTNARGLGNPSATQLQSLGERAVLAAMIEMPWARAFQHLAPGQRQTFAGGAGFVSQWAASIERAVDAKLKQGGGEQAA